MHREKHALVLALPELTDKIHSLEKSNPQFSRLAKDYQRLTQEIHDLEAKNDPDLDEPIKDLKKKSLLKID